VRKTWAESAASDVVETGGPAYFARVRVDPELGSVSWPNGADLDPDVLYGRLTGAPILQEQDVHPAT
jgi:hypothetical protein